MDKSKIWWEFLFKNRIFPKISNKLRYNSISSYDCPNMETRRTKRRNCKRIKTTLFFDIKKFQDLDFRSKSLNLIFFTRYTTFNSTLPSSKRLKIELHYMEPFLKTLWGQFTQSKLPEGGSILGSSFSPLKCKRYRAPKVSTDCLTVSNRDRLTLVDKV